MRLTCVRVVACLCPKCLEHLGATAPLHTPYLLKHGRCGVEQS
jgi:hypothetical protein